MSKQYTPVLTCIVIASGALTANRFVTPAGSQATADANTLGVTRVAAVSGKKIPVGVLGTAIVEAGAAIAPGATLKSDSTGRAVPWATSGPKVGIALDSASAAGQFIEALLIPNAA